MINQLSRPQLEPVDAAHPGVGRQEQRRPDPPQHAGLLDRLLGALGRLVPEDRDSPDARGPATRPRREVPFYALASQLSSGCAASLLGRPECRNQR